MPLEGFAKLFSIVSTWYGRETCIKTGIIKKKVI